MKSVHCFSECLIKFLHGKEIRGNMIVPEKCTELCCASMYNFYLYLHKGNMPGVGRVSISNLF